MFNGYADQVASLYNGMDLKKILLSWDHSVRTILARKWTKVVVFLVCLVPLASLVWRALHAISARIPSNLCSMLPAIGRSAS